MLGAKDVANANLICEFFGGSCDTLAQMAYDMQAPGKDVAFLRNSDNPLAYPLIEELSENTEHDAIRELPPVTPPSSGSE